MIENTTACREDRQCGECQACCQCLAIAELDKPTFEHCPNQGCSGCSIYASRPGSCRSFRCLWLMGFLEEDQRPDLLGVIMVTTEHPVMGKVPMVVEVQEGALRQPNVQQAMAKMRQHTGVVVMTRQVHHVLRQLRPPRVNRQVRLAKMTEQMQPATMVQGG